MKEFMLYINTLKSIVDRYYEKETVFYDSEIGWYSRYHSDYISDENLVEWVLKLSEQEEY